VVLDSQALPIAGVNLIGDAIPLVSAATPSHGRRRAAYLAQHPLCVFCEREGVVTAAAVVDHVVAHQGDHDRFWDSDNWQSLCKRHHDSAKQRQEKGRPEGAGGQKVWVLSLGTGALGKVLRPRNSNRGV